MCGSNSRVYTSILRVFSSCFRRSRGRDRPLGNVALHHVLGSTARAHFRHGRRRHPVPPFLLLPFQWERKAAVSASGKKRLTSITAAASTKKNTVDTTGAVDRYTFK